MSARQRAALAVGLLVLTALAGLSTLASLPAGSHAVGIWPAALGTVACLVVARRWVPLVGLGVLVGDVAALWVGGRSPAFAAVLGVGLAAQSVLTWWFLADHDRDGARGDQPTGRPLLRTMTEVGRLLRATMIGVAALTACGLLAGLLSDSGNPLMLALAVGPSGLAAMVAVLPVACRMCDLPSTAGLWERSAQWLVLLAVAAAVFVPVDSPPLAVLVFPVLAWICLRGSSGDARAKMVLLEVVAAALTSYGRGPLARPDQHFAVPVDTQTVLLAVFVAVTALQVIVLSVSVGEQMQSSRAVASERDRIRGIVESISSTAIIGSDPTGLITLFNPGAERLLGYRAAEVMGRSSTLLHSPASITAKAAELGVADDFGTVARALMGAGQVETGFVRKDGEERTHRMSLHRVYDDRGQVTGHVATSEDITELLEAQRRLVEALDSERAATEHLREIDRVKDAFVSSVSHELRTPLTSILGYLELLQDGSFGPLGDGQDAAVAKVQQNCTRLLSLISDLLDLGRLQEGAAEPGEPLDVAQLVRTAVPMLAPAACSREVRLAVQLPAQPLPVRGQRAPLERVVINLIDNAVKFTERDGRVDVRARIEGVGELGEVVLEVADSGIGIPVAEQGRLFDRFFRSSSALTRAIPGSGLGLSITRTIVEQHGGRIEVASAPDVGTTFTVRLPLDSTRLTPPPTHADPSRSAGRVSVGATGGGVRARR